MVVVVFNPKMNHCLVNSGQPTKLWSGWRLEQLLLVHTGQHVVSEGCRADDQVLGCVFTDGLGLQAYPLAPTQLHSLPIWFLLPLEQRPRWWRRTKQGSDLFFTKPKTPLKKNNPDVYSEFKSKVDVCIFWHWHLKCKELQLFLFSKLLS